MSESKALNDFPTIDFPSRRVTVTMTVDVELKTQADVAELKTMVRTAELALEGSDRWAGDKFTVRTVYQAS